MSWLGVVMSAFITVISFLAMVRNANRVNPYSGSLCDLYLLKYMLPDGHPFEFMYKGLPRTQTFPRLFWPCISTLICSGLTLLFAVLSLVLSLNGVLNNKSADTVFVLTCFGSTIFVDLSLSLITEIQNKVCIKKMLKMDTAQIFQIRAEIEKKWPGFFKYDE